MAKYEIKKIRENMCYNRVVLLRCEFSYPIINVCESFFEEICEKCLLWAREKLYPRLTEEYDSDTDPKKRFTCGYEYRVLITAEENCDGYLDCQFLSYVKKRGSKDISFENKNIFIVRESDGLIISRKHLNRLKKRQDKQKNIDSTVSNDEK